MASPAPSAAAFLEFHRLVTSDPVLFDELSRAENPDAFADRAVALGAARGCTFAAADVSEALRAARRAWIERNVG